MSRTDQNIIAHAKKKAKRLKKRTPEKSHIQCLEQVSQELGYHSYYDLKSKSNCFKGLGNGDYCISKYSNIIQKVIEDCVCHEKPYFKSTFDKSILLSLSREKLVEFYDSHSLTKAELTHSFWELLGSTIDNAADLHKVEWLTRWAINKDKVKEYGREMQSKQSKEAKALGYILVALGHYYRSVMDNCAHQISEHINFETYFGHWLGSMYPTNDTNTDVLVELKQLYPVKGNQELSPNATTWAPQWWLKEQGRI